MSKTQKARILTAIILVISVFVVSVSAEFLSVDKYGIYKDGDPLTVGNALPLGVLSARWALSGVTTDYTYDCWIQVTFNNNVSDDIFDVINRDSYYSTTNPNLWYGLSGGGTWTRFAKKLGSIEKISEKSYKIHLYYNADISGYYSATIQLAQEFLSKGSGSVNWMGQGVGVYYDPGGSNYAEILQLINQNVENLPSRIKQVLEQNNEDIKSEASTEGAGRVEQAKEALQNALPVSAVKDAITPIITACGYNGTDSKWQFPAMSIPAIPGLFDEIPLTEAQDIDLTEYATLYIPETLLMLVRSLLTAGLIMFAIKELMSLAASIFGDEHKGGAS